VAPVTEEIQRPPPVGAQRDPPKGIDDAVGGRIAVGNQSLGKVCADDRNNAIAIDRQDGRKICGGPIWHVRETEAIDAQQSRGALEERDIIGMRHVEEA
jgi:hypothetical protein